MVLKAIEAVTMVMDFHQVTHPILPFHLPAMLRLITTAPLLVLQLPIMALNPILNL